MIQLRLKRIPELAGRALTDTDGRSVAVIDGQPCVLQYKLHFVPTRVGPDSNYTTVLKAGRKCDTQWRDVTVDLSEI